MANAFGTKKEPGPRAPQGHPLLPSSGPRTLATGPRGYKGAGMAGRCQRQQHPNPSIKRKLRLVCTTASLPAPEFYARLPSRCTARLRSFSPAMAFIGPSFPSNGVCRPVNKNRLSRSIQFGVTNHASPKASKCRTYASKSTARRLRLKPTGNRTRSQDSKRASDKLGKPTPTARRLGIGFC